MIMEKSFGSPQGPLVQKTEMGETPYEGDTKRAYSVTNSSSEWKTIAYSFANEKQYPTTNLLGFFLFVLILPILCKYDS